jgi:predicted aspartyl protease
VSAAPEVEVAYEQAVVAVLNAIPGVNGDEAEAMVEAITTLVITTINAELQKELHNEPADHH